MSTWDLSPFYTSVEAWDKDFSGLQEKINHITSFKGKLSHKKDLKAYYEYEEDYDDDE